MRPGPRDNRSRRRDMKWKRRPNARVYAVDGLGVLRRRGLRFGVRGCAREEPARGSRAEPVRVRWRKRWRAERTRQDRRTETAQWGEDWPEAAESYRLQPERPRAITARRSDIRVLE